MKKILIIVCFLLVSCLYAVDFVIPEVQTKFDSIDTSISAIDTTLGTTSTADGILARKVARITWDFDVDGGATTGTLASSVSIPDNAVITSCWYDVLTTATSATDAGTMAIHIPTDGDLQAAIAISDGTNPYDSGRHTCDTKGTDPGDASTFLKTTGSRAVSFVLATEAFTAGKIQVYVEYAITE